MDLHVLAPLPSPAERAAVDAVVPPLEGAAGPHAARGGHAARDRRHLLVPALHAVQARVGWISQPALGYICRRLSVPPAEAYGVASFYALFALAPRPPAVVHLCDDIACPARGAGGLAAELERTVGPAGEPSPDGRTTWLRSPCLGLCERAPAALLSVAGEDPVERTIAPADATSLHLAFAGADPTSSDPDTSDPEARLAEARTAAPQAGEPSLRLLGRVGRIDPASLDDYRAQGGYEALRRAFELGPQGVIGELLASRLVGRGGAAFPTGRKWEAVAKAPAHPHELVCNADESEPGTFKDRVLMEWDPFSVVEAMTIAGVTVGAARGHLYLRGEYPLAWERLTHALNEARAHGLLGPDVLGRGVTFDIQLRRGAGAYIAGEETALFNSIEGRRAEPRNKPPFPVQSGLFGHPTVVNNVETLVNVPLVLRDGGEAFARIGTEGSTGPKLFCLSGHVARPGLYELPFGATLRELLDLAGGVPGGHTLQAVLLGGAAGTCVGPDKLDVPLTFEGTRAAGTTVGSGVVMAFDETVDLRGMLLRIAAFFRDESCGQCVPCRVGTVRQEELLRRLSTGRSHGSAADELRLFDEIAQAMRDASICGLGQTAASAIGSALHGGLVSA
ncbi:MAG: NAD(P)H-dependent oxidoreductase subunit E [Candidatus Limnocylindrales bacterium]